MWEIIAKEDLIGNLVIAGVSEHYTDKRLSNMSVKIGLLGGENVSFPAEHWRKVRETIDLLLAEIAGRGGAEF